MVAVRWVASAASRVNGAEVVAAIVAVVRPLSTDSVCAVVAVRPVRVGAASLMMVASGIINSHSICRVFIGRLNYVKQLKKCRNTANHFRILKKFASIYIINIKNYCVLLFL